MDYKKPIVIWGVGAGGGDRVWEGFDEDGDLLRRLAAYPKLELLMLRDENAHRIFRRAGAPHACIGSCPGLFAIPDPYLRQFKKRCAIAVLDPRTVCKDGLYTCESYYRQIKQLIDGLRVLKADIRLSCQRAFGERPASVSAPILDPDTWRDPEGLDVLGWLHKSGIDNELIAAMKPFLTREDFRNHYSECDVYIGARVHGALPCAGHGMPALGIGIDERRGAWVPVTGAITAVPHQPPKIDVGFILHWYETLDAARVSAYALSLRRYWLNTTRNALMQTSLAGYFFPDAPRLESRAQSA